MPKLINNAEVLAVFDGTPVTDRSTAEVEIPGIQIDKTANMYIWVGDVLTYTIRIKNIDEDANAAQIVFTDTIAVDFAKLVLSSVTVDGIPITVGAGFTYDSATGRLRITAIDDIPAGSGEVRTITFQVAKV